MPGGHRAVEVLAAVRAPRRVRNQQQRSGTSGSLRRGVALRGSLRPPPPQSIPFTPRPTPPLQHRRGAPHLGRAEPHIRDYERRVRRRAAAPRPPPTPRRSAASVQCNCVPRALIYIRIRGITTNERRHAPPRQCRRGRRPAWSASFVAACRPQHSNLPPAGPATEPNPLLPILISRLWFPPTPYLFLLVGIEYGLGYRLRTSHASLPSPRLAHGENVALHSKGFP